MANSRPLARIGDTVPRHAAIIATPETAESSCIYTGRIIGVNTDILFFKSPHEREAYKKVFGSWGPRLEDGCLLSLPNAYELEPLRLPEEYILLLVLLSMVRQLLYLSKQLLQEERDVLYHLF